MKNEKISFEAETYESLTDYLKNLNDKNLTIDEINDLHGDSLENQIKFQNEQIKFKSELQKTRTTNRRRR
ncbi:TPA: hypothetical protein N2952_002101 [Vibrio parahaemolyticus]|uniref:Uncharacterized protein n=1 Tax=Vibrio parahaemolyticus TaxID=670 RepID=A0A227JI48_VIBPH|nr:hypothetical protein [Vibrio parahaemolyticus]EJU9970529.1 hypothetical protein [Vibrio alginolyticus]HDZ3728913.1 hypothetical protein [Vibrio harveyi]EGR0405590.1 hypothetical protein [Vibrio parahaemolyticus]ELJ8803481.1 hypothetical protein [Vibrio parahaemolyticus]ETX23597.1 hypothetical protein D037_2742 [Vibrio parahaemolyticus IDH02640]